MNNSIISILKKIYENMTECKGIAFTHSVEEELKYLNEFKEPNNDIERSYNQYCCQKWSEGEFFKYVLANISAYLVYYFYYIRFRLNKNKIKKKEMKVNVVTYNFLLNGFLPTGELEKENTYGIMENGSGVLFDDDVEILREIKKIVKNEPFFFFKCMCRIAAYSKAIYENNPSIIYCSSEYSFTSSILTYYCEKKNIEHINIMHGDKIFDLRDAFSRFTKFYIWDDFYKKIFFKLRAGKTRYITFKREVPSEINKIGKCVNKYYLQMETMEQLNMIKEILDKSGEDYVVRVHPIYNREKAFKVFDVNRIESNSVNIWDSIVSAKNVISFNSTVLYQAYLLRKPIIIDDMTNPNAFATLKKRSYIMMEKDHILLSEMTKKIS